MTLLGNLWSPMRSSAPITTTSSCAWLFRCSHIRFAGGRLCRRGCVCSVTCTSEIFCSSRENPVWRLYLSTRISRAAVQWRLILSLFGVICLPPPPVAKLLLTVPELVKSRVGRGCLLMAMVALVATTSPAWATRRVDYDDPIPFFFSPD